MSAIGGRPRGLRAVAALLLAAGAFLGCVREGAVRRGEGEDGSAAERGGSQKADEDAGRASRAGSGALDPVAPRGATTPSAPSPATSERTVPPQPVERGSAPASPAPDSPTPGAHGTGAPRGEVAPRSLPAKDLIGAHARVGALKPLPSPVPMEPAPEAILLVSGHTAGWITPCGCTGSQAGGVGRRAGYGELLRKTFPGRPVYYLDLGGFLTTGSDVQRAISDAVVDAMNKIDYQAVNAGWEDLSWSLADAERYGSRLKAPRVSANVVYHDTGELAFAPFRVLTVPPPSGSTAAPLRIGVIGLVDDRLNLFAFGPEGRSLVTRSMTETLQRYIPEMRAQCDVVVLLAEARPDALREPFQKSQASAVIDAAVVGEGEYRSEPFLVEGVPVLLPGNQGKYLVELRVHRKDGKPAITPFIHWLDERFPENPELAKSAEDGLDRINELSRQSIANDSAPPPAIAPFAGADKCGSCHPEAWQVWKESQHARAFETLVALKRDYTVTCVGCHVTGLAARKGGYKNPRATPQLLGVQCEQCHGPGEDHVTGPSPGYGKTSKWLCQSCHSPATDPAFEREVRWKVIAH